MTVMGFQKKFGWVRVYFGFFEFFNFAKPLNGSRCGVINGDTDKMCTIIEFSGEYLPNHVA